MAQSEFLYRHRRVGRMGANMARRLQELRYPVVAVYDCDAQRAKELASELGCMAASTPGRSSRADQHGADRCCIG